MKLLILCCLIPLLTPEHATAFGRKKVNPDLPAAPVAKQATPYRFLELTPITPPAFFLPNGQRIDFNSDLQTIFDSSINSSKYFRTVQGVEAKPRLIISGGITSFELDILQLGLKVGWNRFGPIPISGLTDFQGEVDVKLSALSIDFKIYDRFSGQTYLAKYTNESLSNIKIQFKANLANLVGNIDLLYKSKIAEAIRLASLQVLTQMEKDSNFHLLPWESHITGYQLNKLYLDAGQLAGVANNDIYLAYSHCDDREQNCFERFLAEIRVTRVSPNNSEAEIYNNSGNMESIQANDKIYIKRLE